MIRFCVARARFWACWAVVTRERRGGGTPVGTVAFFSVSLLLVLAQIVVDIVGIGRLPHAAARKQTGGGLPVVEHLGLLASQPTVVVAGCRRLLVIRDAGFIGAFTFGTRGGGCFLIGSRRGRLEDPLRVEKYFTLRWGTLRSGAVVRVGMLLGGRGFRLGGGCIAGVW